MNGTATLPFDQIITRKHVAEHTLQPAGRQCEICTHALSRHNHRTLCWAEHSQTQIKAAVARLGDQARMRVAATKGPFVNRPPTPDELLSFVCLEGNVPLEKLKKEHVRGSSVSIRSVASYLLREDLRANVVVAAEILDLKSSSSVTIAHQKIAEKISDWERPVIDLVTNIRGHYLPL